MGIPLAERGVSTRKERQLVLWRNRKTINFKTDPKNFDSDYTSLYFITLVYHEKHRYTYIKDYARCRCKTFKES